jgi:hypothetical protein
MSNKPILEIPGLIQELYRIVDRLETLFPDRRFTPDGHLVGSIGEVLVASAYGLNLLPSSYEGHDARSDDGRLVQIKATQVRSVGLASEPDHLLVIQIHPDGSFAEIYNGPGSQAWSAAGKMQKNGQRPISLSRLTSLMENILQPERLNRLSNQKY